MFGGGWSRVVGGLGCLGVQCLGGAWCLASGGARGLVSWGFG